MRSLLQGPAFMILPFLTSFLVFTLEYFLLGIDAVRWVARTSSGLFEYTSIYRAFVLSGNADWLYFWIFFLSGIPITIFFVWAYIRRVRHGLWRLNQFGGMSIKLFLGSTAMVLLALYLMVGSAEVYLGSGHFESGKVMRIYPNLLGIFSFSFLVEAVSFFALGPALGAATWLERIRSTV